MAEVLIGTEWRHEISNDDSATDLEYEEEDECSSAAFDEAYNSNEEGAPDLEVEASPIQREGGDGQPAKTDVEASFFSDYEAETRSRASATVAAPITTPLPPLKTNSPAKRLTDVTHAPTQNVLTNAEAVNDGDGFYDAEYASSVGGGQRRTLSPSPVSEVVAHSKQDRAFATSSAHRHGRSNSWLDHLRSLSSPAIDAEGDDNHPAGRFVRAPNGLSDSPRRASEPSPSLPQGDTPLSYYGLPLVTVREGTAAPPPQARPTVSTDIPERRSSMQCSRDYVSALAETGDVLPTSATVQRKRAVLACEVRRGSLISPPPPPLQGPGLKPYDVSPTIDAAQPENATPPPPLQPPVADIARDDELSVPAITVVRAQVPGLHSLSTNLVMDASESQSRVVRDRAPRGVPLLLQCTGHLHTPTHTVAVSSAAGLDGADHDETVNAGLHTSVYREASGISDSMTSFTRGSSAASDKKNVSNGAACCTPERAAASADSFRQLRRHRHRTARSKSPSVSLVDDHSISLGHTNVQVRERTPLSSRTSSVSSRIDSSVVAPPELVDFSVHTEALGRSVHEDSLVLCDYSVKSLLVSTEPSRRDAACEYSSVPRVRCGLRPHSPRSPSTPRFEFPSAANNPSQTSMSSSSIHLSYKQREPGLAASGNLVGAERAGLSMPQRTKASQANNEASHDVVSLPWPSRKLVYPGQPAGHDAASVRARSSQHPSQVFDVRYVIDSVEEAAVGENSDYKYSALVTGQLSGGDGGYDKTNPSSTFFQPPCDVGDTYNGVSTAPISVADYSYDELQIRRQHREAVRQLLARHMDPRRTFGSCNRYDSDGVERGENTAPQHPKRSSAAYVAQQEQLRAQRMVAEAERLRMGLALELCRAVRPYGRDLLLMFLLLVEESNAAQRQRRRRFRTREGSYDTFVVSAQRDESRVSYETCAEAINCVLERHGVSYVRATRELCHRVVAWCRRNQNTATPSLEQSPLSAGDNLVEYTTFVLFVMEFATEYCNNRS